MGNRFNGISSSFGSGGGFGGSGGNKNSAFITIGIILALTLFFNLGGTDDKETDTPNTQETTQTTKEKPTIVLNSSEKEPEKSTTKESEKPEESSESYVEEPTEESQTEFASEKEKENYVMNHVSITPDQLPKYDGTNKNIAVNAGIADMDIDAFFKNKSFKAGWVDFSDLDSLNRVGQAKAFLTPDFYRGSADRASESNISNIKPTGWKNKKVDNRDIYNRSHLIGYAFSKDNVDIPQNLMTGTREFNANKTWGMLYYEDLVRESIKNGNSIMYEVTPIFVGNELIARGVQMRASSYGSDDLDFNVFIYNVQDNISINYLDGTSTKK